MKVRDIFFMIVFAPVLYQFYLVFTQRLDTEIALILTAWLLLVIPTLWFVCKRDRKSKHYLGNRHLGKG